MLELARGLGIGAQFGGKYFCHDVRVIRCPPRREPADRHGRLVLRRPTDPREDHRDGVSSKNSKPNRPAICPKTTRRRLGGEVVQHRSVAADGRDPPSFRSTRSSATLPDRDADRRPRHRARQAQRADRSRRGPAAIHEGLPSITPGPAKTPEGYASGSFGPTTAGPDGQLRRPVQAARRELCDARQGQSQPGGREACKNYGGFYLGGRRPGRDPGERIYQKVEVLEYPELGMEAIWRIEVEISRPLSSSTTRATISSRASLSCGPVGGGVPPEPKLSRTHCCTGDSLRPGYMFLLLWRVDRRRALLPRRDRRPDAGRLRAAVQGRFPAAAQLWPGARRRSRPG